MNDCMLARHDDGLFYSLFWFSDRGVDLFLVLGRHENENVGQEHHDFLRSGKRSLIFCDCEL